MHALISEYSVLFCPLSFHQSVRKCGIKCTCILWIYRSSL